MEFICPDCRGRLISQTDEALRCESCQGSWPIRDGIPVFTRTKDFMWGELSVAEGEDLCETVQKLGWERGVRDFAARLDDRASRRLLFAVFQRGAPWKFLLPLPNEARILDLGCGWGSATFALATGSREVVSMDLNFFRARFVDIKRRQAGIDHIVTACGGDAPYLPFPDASFDGVVMSGVLEWVPISRDGDPLEGQRGFIREVSRVLKPQGFLYLAIENRFGYPYLFGRRDGHSGLRYGNVLPRALANLYSRAAMGKEFRTYTHSYWGLREILRQGGFRNIDYYWPIPHYRNIKWIFPLTLTARSTSWLADHVFEARNWKSWKSRTRAKGWAYMGILKYLVPHYSLVAQKKTEVD
jgi:ubiquinone/menaquinone biosynthesis C-methylase UbiE